MLLMAATPVLAMAARGKTLAATSNTTSSPGRIVKL
jgi:hypothetical protein